MVRCIKPMVKSIDLRRKETPATKRIRGSPLRKIRERIMLRDEYTCRGCGRVSDYLEVDHIVPLHLGGRESDENRQALCHECHQKKTEREEKEKG